MLTEQAVTLAVNNLDEVAPTITSGATAAAIDENSGADQVVYTATANDSRTSRPGDVQPGRRRCGAFQHRRDQRRGDADRQPELRGQAELQLHGAGRRRRCNTPTEQAVTLAVNNLDEIAPTITSGATAAAIDENSGADQVVYTATANDSADISAG